MNKGLIISLCGFLFLGCVHTQTSFDEVVITSFIDKTYQLETKSGEIMITDTLENNITYRIKFHKVQGGDSKFLGFVQLNEGNGYKAKRLIISKNEQVYRLSINEITHSLKTLKNIDLGKFTK